MTRPRGPLSDRDMETFGELIACQDNHLKRGYSVDRGFAPLDFGGSNGSHHGATATKLAGRGLVEQKKRGWNWGETKGRWHERGSKAYRPTQAGRDAYAKWREGKRP